MNVCEWLDLTFTEKKREGGKWGWWNGVMRSLAGCAIYRRQEQFLSWEERSLIHEGRWLIENSAGFQLFYRVLLMKYHFCFDWWGYLSSSRVTIKAQGSRWQKSTIFSGFKAFCICRRSILKCSGIARKKNPHRFHRSLKKKEWDFFQKWQKINFEGGKDEEQKDDCLKVESSCKAQFHVHAYPKEPLSRICMQHFLLKMQPVVETFHPDV